MLQGLTIRTSWLLIQPFYGLVICAIRPLTPVKSQEILGGGQKLLPMTLSPGCTMKDCVKEALGNELSMRAQGPNLLGLNKFGGLQT